MRESRSQFNKGAHRYGSSRCPPLANGKRNNRASGSYNDRAISNCHRLGPVLMNIPPKKRHLWRRLPRFNNCSGPTVPNVPKPDEARRVENQDLGNCTWEPRRARAVRFWLTLTSQTIVAMPLLRAEHPLWEEQATRERSMSSAHPQASSKPSTTLLHFENVAGRNGP